MDCQQGLVLSCRQRDAATDTLRWTARGRAGVMNTAQPLAFGTLLRRHRIAVGLTQEELAERARISRRSIGDLERGVSLTPHRDTLALLADALDLSPQDR